MWSKFVGMLTSPAFAAVCLVLATLFAILAVSLPSWSVEKTATGGPVVPAPQARETYVGLWQTCSGAKQAGCSSKCVYHLSGGILNPATPAADEACFGQYEATERFCRPVADGGGGTDSQICRANKTKDSFLRAAAAMCTIGMIFMIFAFLAAVANGGGSGGGSGNNGNDASGENGGGAGASSSSSSDTEVKPSTGPCNSCCSPSALKLIISLCSLFASICFLVTIGIVAGGCPCSPDDEANDRCNDVSVPRRFCLMPVYTSCGDEQADAPITIYSAGAGFVCCVLAWIFALCAAITYHCGRGNSHKGTGQGRDSRDVSLPEALKGAIPALVSGLANVEEKGTSGSVDYFACAHQLLSLLQLIFLVAILDHNFGGGGAGRGAGASSYGAVSTYPANTVAFYPLPGPFSPLLPMLGVFMAGLGRVGASRGWGNCLAAFYFFCMFSGMLYVWYAGNIWHDYASYSGLNAHCLFSGCLSNRIANYDDDLKAPECLPR